MLSEDEPPPLLLIRIRAIVTPAAIKSKWALLAAITAFVLIAVLRINTAYVILLFAVLGMAVAFAGSRGGGESE